MPFQDDLKLTHIELGLKGAHPDQMFQNIARILSVETDLPPSSILSELRKNIDRGDPNIGDGLMICDWLSDGIRSPVVSLFRPEKPVDLGGDDPHFIDMFLVLISPEKESMTHLRHLARLTRLFRDETLLQHVRAAHSEDVVLSLMQKENRRLLAA